MLVATSCLLSVLQETIIEEKQIENINKQPVQTVNKDSLEQGQCTITKWKRKRNEVFPFNVCDRIEIVTYDSTDGYDLGKIGYSTILTDSIGQYGFCERVPLNEKQIDTLFSIMYGYISIDDLHISAACYNPRHAILFYKGNTLVEYFEICFECMGTEYLRNQSRFPQFCNEQWCYLQEFFKRSGVKKRLGKLNCK